MSTSRAPPGDDSIERALEDLARTAKDLTVATAKCTERILAKAGSAAKDPSGAVQKVTRRIVVELDAARQGIERALRDLQ
ncbi:MAG: hypothetical protein WCA77_00355 [Thermoplasmata archaeon]